MKNFVIAVSFCFLSLLLAEFLSMGYFFLQNGRFLSVKEMIQKDRVVHHPKNEPQDCAYYERLHPHPYLSFVSRKKGKCGATDRKFGLLGMSDLNLEKKPDVFQILLTGGSVASYLGTYQGKGSGSLEDVLNKKLIPPEGKKRFQVAVAAFGAWRYPQQTISTHLFGHLVDAVITLDGFNEYLAMHFGRQMGYPPESYFMLNPQISGNATTSRIWLISAMYRKFDSFDLLSHSNLSYLVLQSLRVLIRNAGERFVYSEGEDEIDSFFSLPQDWSQAKKWDYNLNIFKNEIRTINRLGDLHNFKSAHFLQPIPQVGKTLTQEERAYVKLKGVDMSDYTLLVRELLSLKSEGIDISSLADLFKDEKETIYIDHIHYKMKELENEQYVSRGNEVLIGALVEHLQRQWNLKAR